MKRAASVAVFVSVLLVLCAGLRCSQTDSLAGGSSTEGGNVVGVVVYPDRAPVPDARVLMLPRDFTADTTGATDSRICSTSTAADGSFDIDSVESGAYAVLVYAVDGGAKAGPVWVMQAQRTDLDTLVIAPYGGVRGRVEVIHGSPELVTATVPGTFERVRAGSDSTFTVAPLPPGEYTVIVSCPGSVEPPETTTVRVEGGDIAAIPGVFVFHLQYLYGALTKVDTVIVLRNQLPVDVSVSLHSPQEDTDTPRVRWTVNRRRAAFAEPSTGTTVLTLTDSMLSADTNTMALSVTYADTVVGQTWIVAMGTWVRFAPTVITGTVLSRAITAGTQRHLWCIRVDTAVAIDSTLLTFWHGYPECRGFDTHAAAPAVTAGRHVRVPAYGDHYDWFASRYPQRCAFEAGDTATFIVTPDKDYGSRAFRIRTDEHARDFAHITRLDTSRLPWLTMQADAGRPGSATPVLDFGEPHMTADGLLLERYRKEGKAVLTQCYRILADGEPVELRAAPGGISDTLLAFYQLDEARAGYAWDAPLASTDGWCLWVGSSGTIQASADGVVRQQAQTPAALDTLRSLLDTWTAAVAHPDTAHLRQTEASFGSRRYLLHEGAGRFLFSTEAVGCDAAAALSRIEGFFVAHGLLPRTVPPLMPGAVERYVRILCHTDGSITYGADTLLMTYSFSECGAWEVREYFTPTSPLAAVLPDTNRFVLHITADRMTVEDATRTPQLFRLQGLSATGIPLRDLAYGPEIPFTGWEPDSAMEGRFLEGHTRDIELGGRSYPVLNVLINGVDLASDGCAELFIYSRTTGIVRMLRFCAGGLPAPDSFAATGWERVY